MSQTARAHFQPSAATCDHLPRAAALCLGVFALGQGLFGATILLFYGVTTWRGDIFAWNKLLITGYIAGEPVGNSALIAHILAAVPLVLGGALQCLPQLRRRVPALHRWNGRIFVVAAILLAGAGIMLELLHDPDSRPLQAASNYMLAAIILISAANALRLARARDFRRHRIWALRLYVAVSSSIVIRASVSLLTLILLPFGAAGALSLHGPLFTVIGYAQFVVPLALLEIYLRAERTVDIATRNRAAVVLAAVSLFLGAGIASSTVVIFGPKIEAAFDTRASIAKMIDSTAASSGMNAAIAQYRLLHAHAGKHVNFDEDELETLGAIKLRQNKTGDAIALLELNAEIYPSASSAWNNLGDAYRASGDIAMALAKYRHALSVNPASAYAKTRLGELGQ